MTDDELIFLNHEGFIPGPSESEEEFVRRVQKTRALAEKSNINDGHWSWARLHLKELFEFEAKSLPVFYSNKKLAPWQGAACWINELNIPELQLREGFRKGRYLFGLYSRDEILSHEAIHAARAAFNEPENEEFFAYASSTKRWRQVLGPFIASPWQIWLLWGLLVGSFFFSILALGAFLFLGMKFYRLISQHRRLAHASLLLQARLKDVKKVRALLLRLTDREIRDLASGKWIEPDGSLRFRLIQLAYFAKLA